MLAKVIKAKQGFDDGLDSDDMAQVEDLIQQYTVPLREDLTAALKQAVKMLDEEKSLEIKKMRDKV
jgi:hypothetical protein